MSLSFAGLLNSYSQLSKQRRITIAILLFAFLGTLFVLATRAASEYAAFESEQATRSESALVVSDTEASGGSYIAFGSESFFVAITEPSAGSTVSGTITLSASYSGNVQNVEFYNGDTKLSSATLDSGTATASFNTATSANGNMTIIARAWDSPPGQDFTQTIDSAPVTVTVQNESGGGVDNPPRQPVVNVKDFGATGNGSTDDTGAIQAAIDSAGSGGTIYFPAGTYIQTDNISISADNVHLWTDASARIHATNDNAHTIYFGGSDGSGIYNLNITSTANQDIRGNGDFGRYRVRFEGSSNNTVSGITLDGAGNFGIHMRNTSYYLVENNIVRNTGADGIHSGEGANNGLVRNNTLTHIGDDCFPVVSTFADPISHDIIFENNTCTDSWHARGFAVVGGRDIIIRNNVVNGSKAAGIYLSSESVYGGTHGTSNIQVLNNQISGASYGTGHASIFMYSDTGRLVDNILIAGNTIDTQGLGGAVVIAQDSYQRRINIIGNNINDGRTPFSLNTSSSEYNLKGNKQNGNNLPDEINNPGIIPAGY